MESVKEKPDFWVVHCCFCNSVNMVRKVPGFLDCTVCKRSSRVVPNYHGHEPIEMSDAAKKAAVSKRRRA